MEHHDRHTATTSGWEVEVFTPNGHLCDILTVDFEGDILIVDNGIGAYECHGMIGRDIRLEPEIQKITWDRTKYTDFENSRIERFLNENWEEIHEAIEDEFSCEIY